MDFHIRGNLRKNATRPTWWQTKELCFFLLPFCAPSDLCILLTRLHPDVLEHPGILLKFLSLIVFYQPIFFVSNIWCLWALEDTKKFSLRIYSIKITFSGLQGMEREREREEEAELRWCLVGGRTARSVATAAYVSCVCQNVHNVQ